MGEPYKAMTDDEIEQYSVGVIDRFVAATERIAGAMERWVAAIERMAGVADATLKLQHEQLDMQKKMMADL
jgi:hypothetical protein